jgi:hypothetical protein
MLCRFSLALAAVICLLLENNAMAQPFSYSRDFPILQKRSLDQTDSLYFPRLLQRFQANDTTLADGEVLALLVGFTNDPHYNPYEDLDISRRVRRLNAQEDYKAGLALADSFLLTHPVDQLTLYEKAFALYELGKEPVKSKYLDQYIAIMSAMESTGDGRSPATAIFALGPADGQDYIHKHLGRQLGRMGSGYDKDHHFLDILDGISEDGKDTVTYYFNIDHAMAGFRKQLQDAKK